MVVDKEQMTVGVGNIVPINETSPQKSIKARVQYELNRMW